MITWKYETIDNFLDNDDFDLISGLYGKLNPAPEKMWFSVAKITKQPESHIFHKERKWPLTDAQTLMFQRKYEAKLIDLLYKHAPHRIKEINYFELTIAVSGKGYKHFPHLDKLEKLLSVVVYIQPEKNMGTVLYEVEKGKTIKGPNKVKPLYRTVSPWARNRALIFAKSGDSWHSWRASPDSDRLILMFNLKCYDGKKIIEKDQGSKEDFEYISDKK
jgi:hypothetical protein